MDTPTSIRFISTNNESSKEGEAEKGEDGGSSPWGESDGQVTITRKRLRSPELQDERSPPPSQVSTEQKDTPLGAGGRKRKKIRFRHSLSDSELIRRNPRQYHEVDAAPTHCLPVIAGKHKDLPTISGSVLSSLMKGEMEQKIETYQIIDCRFPYEYSGGHIRGAVNMFTSQQMFTLLKEASSRLSENLEKKNVLVFYCEISLGRSPTLLRLVRDTIQHLRTLCSRPSYPECYLLHGGYRAFFAGDQKTLCEPQAIVRMQDPAFIAQMKHYMSLCHQPWVPSPCQDTRFPVKSLADIEKYL